MNDRSTNLLLLLGVLAFIMSYGVGGILQFSWVDELKWVNIHAVITCEYEKFVKNL